MTLTRRLAVALLALALLATACGGSSDAGSDDAASDEPVLAGYERDPDPTVSEYSLPAVNRDNADFAFRADPGELLMVYFAFTNCPDFCPTTLADTKIALNLLEERAEAVDVAVVTIDPARDSAEILTDYVTAFIDDGIALRTDDQALLQETAFAFGADFRIEESEAGEIEVGHTTHLFLVDDTGSMILTWPFGITTDDIANDLGIMLDRIDNRPTTP